MSAVQIRTARRIDCPQPRSSSEGTASERATALLGDRESFAWLRCLLMVDRRWSPPAASVRSSTRQAQGSSLPGSTLPAGGSGWAQVVPRPSVPRLDPVAER